MRNTFAAELLKAAKANPRIVLITGDLGFGVFDEFRSELPLQFINSGVAEQSMMGMAAGLASQGYRPFVYSIANFPTFRCLEQIRNDVAYMNNPVTIISVGAGMGYGAHGYSHHAIEDIAIMRVFKDVDIYSPSDPQETVFCLDKILKSSAPAYLRLGKGGEVNLKESFGFQLQNQELKGKDIKGYVFWTGGIGAEVLKAKQELENEGINFSAHSFPEISRDAISKAISAAGKLPVLTVEEHVYEGGFGSAVLEVASDLGHLGFITRLAIDSDNKHRLGSQTYLRQLNEIDANSIALKLKALTK
jgi:transketolase